MRRLYSTFAEGLPGVGLLLLRLVAGTGILAHGLTELVSGLSTPTAIVQVLAIAAAVLLVAGLWTPIAGLLVALLGMWNCFAHQGDLWPNILLTTIGAALALLGPGAWSLDVRLFGWKQIEVLNRKD